MMEINIKKKLAAEPPNMPGESAPKKGPATHSLRVVIVGGGFAGLYAAKSMKNLDADITLIDRRNFHLFQPLLYQVATGGLSPGDIASPLRVVLSRYKNIKVVKSELRDINPENNEIITADGQISYDVLIIATGTSHHYFGHDQWAQQAPALKTVEDALDIRRRLLQAFELAEKEPDGKKRRDLLRFLIVGGGPTGVELAGALAELSRKTMKNDFRSFDPADSEIILVEGLERILSSYPESLSLKARKLLERLGVRVMTGTLVTRIDDSLVTLKSGERIQELKTGGILWAAGVKASPVGRMVHEKTGAKLDKMGRVMVNPDLTIEGYPEIFVIGDLANYPHQTGSPLPGVAPVAIQQGQYVAMVLENRLKGKAIRPFRYRDQGNLAVIGRNAAIAHFGPLKISGFAAWFIWVFIHIAKLIEFDNKLLVMVQWAWDYFTWKRGARLITMDE